MKIAHRGSVSLRQRLACIIEYIEEECREILTKPDADGATDWTSSCDTWEHSAYFKYPVSRYARAAPG
jgi:hypothetical protein